MFNFWPFNIARKRRERQEAERREAGWDFAAGRLLAGDSLDTVEAWASYGVDFDGPNPWDAGMKAACRAWFEKFGN